MRMAGVVAAALAGITCAKAPAQARAADPPAANDRTDAGVAASFVRTMPRGGPSVSFNRDAKALSVSINAGPWRDLTINFPSLRGLGLRRCGGVDLVLPIGSCRFNPNDSEVHRCSDAATARFHLDDDKRIVPATRASPGTEELQRITTVDAMGAHESWTFRLTTFVCLNETKCAWVSIELPK